MFRAREVRAALPGAGPRRAGPRRVHGRRPAGPARRADRRRPVEGRAASTDVRGPGAARASRAPRRARRAPAGPTRSASTWPPSAIPSWATAPTAARARRPRRSGWRGRSCTRRGSRSATRSPGEAVDLRRAAAGRSRRGARARAFRPAALTAAVARRDAADPRNHSGVSCPRSPRRLWTTPTRKGHDQQRCPIPASSICTCIPSTRSWMAPPASSRPDPTRRPDAHHRGRADGDAARSR